MLLNTLRRLVNGNGKRVYKTILLLEITYSFPCKYIFNGEKLFENCYLSEPGKLYRLMIVRDSNTKDSRRLAKKELLLVRQYILQITMAKFNKTERSEARVSCLRKEEPS